MLILQAINITMSYGDHNVITVPFSLDVYSGDKIGIVGMNGAGKTTLLRILFGEIIPDRGFVKFHSDVHFFRQTEENLAPLDREFSKTHREFCDFNIENPEALSSGQITRLKLADVFSKNGILYFIDEPTSNLDLSGKKLLLEKMRTLSSYLLICHDRNLLDLCCNKILEIEKGKVTPYTGNYSYYIEEKKRIFKKMEKEYFSYMEEQKRLNLVYKEHIQHAEKVRKKPKDKGKQIAGRIMGGRSKDTKQKAIQSAAKATMVRMEREEIKEKPHKNEVISIEFSRNDPPENKIVIRIEGLTFGFGEKILFDDVNLYVQNKQRLAILGDNGIGKSTLFRLIVQGYEGILAAPKVRFGYFVQDLSSIDLSKTVYQNALEKNIQDISRARTILRRMLFSVRDLDKPAFVLSGGERVRLALVKLVLSGANLLVLDEVTNYLDIPSIEAIEELLSNYPGTLLFTSHDLQFVKAIATDAVKIENGKIMPYSNFSVVHDIMS